MINKSNYESYLIDYLDGNLAPHEEAALVLFLDEHPEIAEEFEGLADVQLAAPPSVFDASSLMKDPSDERDMLLARLLEGDLDGTIQQEVEKKIADDPNWKKDWELMQATRIAPTAVDGFDHGSLLWSETLSAQEEAQLLAIDHEPQATDSAELIALRKIKVNPDSSIVFPGKAGLKRTPVITMTMRWLSVVAAVGLLLISLPFWNVEEASTANRIPGIQTGNDYADGDLYPEEYHTPSSEDSTPMDALPFYASNPSQANTPGNATPDSPAEDRPTLMHVAALKPSRIHQVSRVPALAGYEVELPTMAQLPDQQPVAEEFVTGREFFTHQVKKNLWGEENYPEEGYVLALAEKGANKISDKFSVDVDPTVQGNEKRRFRFRLGSFEFSR